MSWVAVFIPVLVAIITGPAVVLLQKLRSENTTQHAESRGLLEHLVMKVDRIDYKIDDHLKDGHNHKRGVA
jgi:hypothetical protein